jgi:class 3 adenylate cyclase
LVSVLFADLVGFTSLSERRDPEVVREMLSGYFERCRTLIERYGGTVEKFIGDAVMAVWGRRWRGRMMRSGRCARRWR